MSIADGLARAMGRLAEDEHFDAIVMSLGAYTLDDEPPPLAAAIKDLVDPAKTLVVAAAGNASSCRPYWPAALPAVVAVGALDSAGRAWFSNFGGWVDACAPGVDVRSTFYGTDGDPLKDPVGDPNDGLYNEFKGWAMWSGTSFAAPKVAAVIAAEASRLGISAPEAWKLLSHYQHFRYPDLGVVVNVV
jgi:subtilisin family serine protease